MQRTKNERKVMDDKFDELAKKMAQSVTRRSALKKFGVGLAAAVLASLGLVNKAQAQSRKACLNKCSSDCTKQCGQGSKGGVCWGYCYSICAANCPTYD